MSIQSECTKHWAPVLSCWVYGDDWHQVLGRQVITADAAERVGQARVSWGLAERRTRTFLTEEKRMQSYGSWSGGRVGWGHFQAAMRAPQGRGGHTGRAWQMLRTCHFRVELHPQPASLRRFFSPLCHEIWLRCRSPWCLFRELLGLSSSYKITSTLGA